METVTFSDQYDKEAIEAFAEKLKVFFYVFDTAILDYEPAEGILANGIETLEDKVSFCISGLPAITAMGGSYDSSIDSAKLDEASALLQLLRARKRLRAATLHAAVTEKRHSDLLQNIFGIGGYE